MSTTTTLDRTDTDPVITGQVKVTTSNDKPESAHIVMVPPGEPDQSPHAYIMRARVEGFPITALCGYVWIPNKQATGLPVCDECSAIHDYLMSGKDGFGETPEE